MTTLENITDEQIKTLGEEAREHGDHEQYEICQLALGVGGGSVTISHGLGQEGKAPRTHEMRFTRDEARHACAEVIYAAELASQS